MKLIIERPYADPEAAARKLVELAAGVEPIDGRIHIEKINYPFMSKEGCNGSGRSAPASNTRSRRAGSTSTRAALM